MHHFFVKRQEKTMQTLRDIRFSKDKVNTLACTKTITNTKTFEGVGVNFGKSGGLGVLLCRAKCPRNLSQRYE